MKRREFNYLTFELMDLHSLDLKTVYIKKLSLNNFNR
jgi:hypothetical protein